jgi:hypothetical protein
MAVLGAVGGGMFGGGEGFILAIPTGELLAPIAVPLGAFTQGIAGAAIGKAIGVGITNVMFSRRVSIAEDNAEPTAGEIISREKKGSINRVFPGQFNGRTLSEIKELAKKGDRAAKTAMKLLTDSRFNK